MSITIPLRDGGALRDASLTSPALSPKIALSSFSSGVGSDSPFGVILPIKISPGFTSAPTLIIPFSSSSLVASSLTFGISSVSSSVPNLVSLTSIEYSSIWIEVNTSSLTTLSEITIASSKLYPFHGMKATLRFLPRANSPFWVAYPSHKTCPFSTLSPFLTIGFKLTHVPWFVFLNLIRLYVCFGSSNESNFSSDVKLWLIIILSASTYSTVPPLLALIKTLESDATDFSKPVPTIGDSGLSRGTACLIIFEPIKALFASSCSRNGIKDAEIDAIWFGATSV